MIKNLDIIKDKTELFGIVGRYVLLKRSGSNFVGCCPFHDEKSASFVVSPKKNNYVCYGCGKSGDTIKFLMEYRKLTFVEAVEDMAATIGVTVEYEIDKVDAQIRYQKDKDARTAMYDILNRVSYLLVPAEYEIPERVELDGRTYSKATAVAFMLGFHLPFALFNGKESAKLTIEELIKASLLRKSERYDGHYETFANRSIYPIQDKDGRVVALAGRKQPGAKEDAPKYLNSAESIIYNKSRTLYGLHQAQRHITKAGFAIVVEGYTDLLTLYDNGIQNVVATCGTALTEDHAKLLAKYTDKVTLLLDGDPAGISAGLRAVNVLAGHVSTNVALLPIDEPTPGVFVKCDPDSYCRAKGPDAIKEVLTTAKDAVIWCIMYHHSKDDVNKQVEALKLAARILASMDTTNRGIYLKKLTEKGNLGNVKAELTELIDAKLAEGATLNQWNKTEEDAITKYGIYESSNCYMSPLIEGKGAPLSNFVIKTMTLVVGNRESERIIEIVHTSGNVMQARIDSEVFTKYQAFEEWIEGKGPYYFYEGASKVWSKIRRFVVDKMLTVFPVTKLGWHREGFWVWRNGILSNGNYIPVGPGGIVTHEGVHYMLTMSINMNNSKSDDVGRQADTPYFSFLPERPKPDFTYFGKLMQRAYGKKSVVGMAYIIASIFRDLVWEHEDYFPLMNIFGMPGSGKNKYYEMLIAMFGSGGRFYDLTNTTAKALPRLFAQVSNGVVWLDEYRNELDDEILAILTNAYNGSGRSMADYTGGTETKVFDVTSAVIVSGEHRPTRRMALYTRCIAQETLTANFDDDTTDAYEKVREIARAGGLTHVVAELLKFRPNIQSEFTEALKTERGVLKMALYGQKIEDRLVGNYAILTAIASVLERNDFALPFNLDILRDECYKGIIHQSSVIGSEDPISSFWRIISFLYEAKMIQHGSDLIIEDASSVRVIAKGEDTIEKTFDEPKRLLFLRLQKAHGLYLEYFQRQFRGQGMAIGTLEHYLFTNHAFVGSMKAKRFGNSTLRCHVFDLSKIPVQFRTEIPEGPTS